MVAPIRSAQGAPCPAVTMRTGAHRPRRCQIDQIRHRSALRVEKLVRPIASQPLLEQRQVAGIASRVRDRDLVRAPEPLDPKAIDLLRAGPALGCTQHDERPAGRSGLRLTIARRATDAINARKGIVQRVGHGLMHRIRNVSRHDDRVIAHGVEQGRHLRVWLTAENGGVGDLVAIEMEDGQDRAIMDGIETGDGLPGGGQGPGFRFSVTDHASDGQLGIVEGRAEGVGKGVTQFTALMDRPGGFGPVWLGTPPGAEKRWNRRSIPARSRDTSG